MPYTDEDRAQDRETVDLAKRLDDDVKAGHPATSLYWRLQASAQAAQSRLATK